MSDDIAKMNDRQLRNEVQLLRDEIAIMKRKYEDIIYNLDTDNFSSRFTKEQGDMKTAIEITAKGVESKVSKEDFESTIKQTASSIETEVKKLNDKDNELSSKITQTAEGVETTVKSVVNGTYIKDKLGNEYLTDALFRSNLQQDAYGIYATVQATYETKADAEAGYDTLIDYISSVSVDSDLISTKVSKLENGEYEEFTLFEQKTDGFYLTGDVHLSGDLISGGTITGATFKDSGGTAKLEMGADGGSDVGDLRLIRIDTRGGETNIFSVYDNFTGIGINAFDDSFIYTTGTTTYPQGVWDFSECTSVDFGDFVTGGSSVAKFG
jgi:hypothetical protein